MKKLLMILAGLSLFVVSCSSTGSGSYFGYNNKPDYEQANSSPNQPDIQTDNSNAGWVNPMGGNNRNSQNDFVYSDYSYRYNPHIYVPVIMPWWNSYHGWVSYPFPGSHISMYYSNFWGYDWYSPWYSYHPCHGYYWGPSYASHHHYWYSQPVYTRSDRPIQKNTYRSFGANRGSYSYTSSNRQTSSSSGRSSSGIIQGVSGRNESSSSRVINNTSNNVFRNNSVPAASGRTSSERSVSNSDGNSKTFKPYNAGENSRSLTSPQPASSDKNVFKSGTRNSEVKSTSGSGSGRTYSEPSSGSSGSSRSSGSSAESSGRSTSEKGSSSSGSSSSGSSSSGRGSSSGSSSGRTR